MMCGVGDDVIGLDLDSCVSQYQGAVSWHVKGVTVKTGVGCGSGGVERQQDWRQCVAEVHRRQRRTPSHPTCSCEKRETVVGPPHFCKNGRYLRPKGEQGSKLSGLSLSAWRLTVDQRTFQALRCEWSWTSRCVEGLVRTCVRVCVCVWCAVDCVPLRRASERERESERDGMDPLVSH
jgi:hypothetical protein